MAERQKRIGLIGMIAVSVLPILAIIPIPSVVSLKAYSLYLSAITGYFGVILLLWMFILGTRATTRYFFVDTAPVLKIHSWLGKYGSVAILLHPLLVIYAYGESLLYTVVPHISSLSERHITLGRISFLLIAVIWITSSTLRKQIPYRAWKYIHYLAYISLPFALLHVPNIGSAYLTQMSVKVYYFVLVVTTLVFAIIRLRSFFNLDRTSYTVSHINGILENTFVMTLQSPDGIQPPRLGQYVYVKLGFISEDHPFSVVQYDENTREITLAFRVFGTFTDSLSRLSAGDEVLLDGPYGTFTHEILGTNKPVVFIAGGIGITPFIDHILSGNNDDMWLFYASPNETRATFLQALRHELGERCIPVYSQHQEPSAELGYIDANKIRKYIAEPSKYSYFMCGPEQMMESSRTALQQLGVRDTQIFSESFVF